MDGCRSGLGGITGMMSHVLDVRVIGIVEGIVLRLAVSRNQCGEAHCQTNHFDEREL